MKIVVLLACLWFATSSQAAVEIREFKSPQHEARYHAMLDELRCLVCQNQNLAESNAGLARDLRDKTYEMIQSDRTDSEIVGYMVQRYGDFVLYRPPLKSSTLVLWYGPLLILLIAIAIYWSYSKRARNRYEVEMTAEQRERVKRLLEDR